MKQLTVIRHAKSSWGDPMLGDFARPLNGRGMNDAPAMGQHLRSRDVIPGLIVTSPAVRARATAGAIAAALGLGVSSIHEEPDIYAADVADLLGVVRGFGHAFEHVFLVGHNPGVYDLVYELTGAALPKMPTCGVANLTLDVADWRRVSAGTAVLSWFVSPRMLDG